MSRFSRRGFMGSALTFSTVSGFSCAANIMDAGLLQNHTGTLVLYRASDADSAAFAAALASEGIETIALADDPVRQWRDGVGSLVTEQNRLLLGMGNWADYSIIKGLAAEHRRFALLTLQHPVSKQLHADWAVRHAQELLTLASLRNSSALQQVLDDLAVRRNLEPAAPSLFSWVIG